MKDRIKEALREAILFLEAPPDSPRHWAVSRGNLMKILREAHAQRKADHDTELARCKSGILKMAMLHGRIPAILMIRTIHPGHGLKSAMDLLNLWEGRESKVKQDAEP